MARTKIVLAVIAVIVIVAIALQNTTGVDANILFFSANVPLAALLLLSFVAGVVAGLLAALAFGGRRDRAANEVSAGSGCTVCTGTRRARCASAIESDRTEAHHRRGTNVLALCRFV